MYFSQINTTEFQNTYRLQLHDGKRQSDEPTENLYYIFVSWGHVTKKKWSLSFSRMSDIDTSITDVALRLLLLSLDKHHKHLPNLCGEHC